MAATDRTTSPGGVRVYKTFTVIENEVAEWCNSHREWVPVAAWPPPERPTRLLRLLCVQVLAPDDGQAS